jgi:hypothetical protein
MPCPTVTPCNELYQWTLRKGKERRRELDLGSALAPGLPPIVDPAHTKDRHVAPMVAFMAFPVARYLERTPQLLVTTEG